MITHKMFTALERMRSDYQTALADCEQHEKTIVTLQEALDVCRAENRDLRDANFILSEEITKLDERHNQED